MGFEVGGQAVLGRQSLVSTPWLTERHGYDPTCGTGTVGLPSRHFSTAQVPRHRERVAPVPAHRLSVNANRIWFDWLPTGLHDAHLVAATPPQRPASVKRPDGGTGLSTRCPSPSAFAYGLGPTNPPRITRAAEPSGLRRWRFTLHFSVTHSGIRTRRRSTRAYALTSTHRRRSPTARVATNPQHRQMALPRYSIGAALLDQ